MQAQLIASLLAAGLSAAAFAAPEKFVLDATHTYPTFEVNHMGFSITRGMFKETEGKLELDRAAKTGSLDATINTKSIESGHEKRDEHLRGKDFFNVAEFPTAVVKADKFTFDSDKPVSADGTLTMLGVTKPVKLNIVPMKCDMRMGKDFVCGADVTTTIKRSEWGMKAYVPFVGDDVKIMVQVEAIKQK
ncbi:YceI family protein [Chitinimonas sp. BJB300]|uniref:YceI family protein n=1 Tax=Chitinimonas sp. BJB300 TaxID=1559339 RepID=UPI000C0D27D5|nr:YceI family protein [Chitinimonas sp. BJB300]PHV10623.1 polyisoprenoid-binding protein [Chitinimonas sp. BJB300]TSJ87692.1 YceI family protein [Chitinimonas sp. BJB300]